MARDICGEIGRAGRAAGRACRVGNRSAGARGAADALPFPRDELREWALRVGVFVL